MQNNPNVPNGPAPDTATTAEALSMLASLRAHQQCAPPHAHSIFVGATRTEVRSILAPGRLRGTMHYEAMPESMAQDKLGKFLKAIDDDPDRAVLVRSVKLSLECDHFKHSGVAELFNQDVLPYYPFTDDETSEEHPPLTYAPLYLKNIQRRMAHEPRLSQHPTCPTDIALPRKEFFYMYTCLSLYLPSKSMS
ncbi:uncharacterized protein CC84DRAFT_316108 [Paraphaeosphaeria sporulosa]|uniref:Uncharacterized protein n=1 Tax=Paraphaeosphaeria sporulosa TaxID=1460663 RepID=A0A177BYZ4_9PLEO|nr:uncharacterized protein CC84DRAFT_316108 [Paraphaeosphaeria sporulosa]OAG00593.1 hypothetical protein CC84DRAFT_316108 [Paraphaeosphaeria sporulosa]